MTDSPCELMVSILRVTRRQARVESRKASEDGDFIGAVAWEYYAGQLNEYAEQVSKTCRR